MTVEFVLTGLNQTFTLGVSGELAGAAAPALDISCVANYNIKTSDMRNVFKFQTDSFDVNNVDASDIKYYVYMNAWPADLSLNPANAHTLADTPILPNSTDVVAKRNFVKHDFVRYLAKKLFNTPYGVDLFSNETQLLEDLVTKGATAASNIITALNAVNQSSASKGSTPHRYSENDLIGTSNFSRELLRQVAHHAPERFAGISDISGIQSIPLVSGDSISFKVSIAAAANQHSLTSVAGPFDNRVYKIKLTLTEDGSATQIVPDESDSTAQYPYHTAV